MDIPNKATGCCWSYVGKLFRCICRTVNRRKTYLLITIVWIVGFYWPPRKTIQ